MHPIQRRLLALTPASTVENNISTRQLLRNAGGQYDHTGGFVDALIALERRGLVEEVPPNGPDSPTYLRRTRRGDEAVSKSEFIRCLVLESNAK